MFEIDASKYYNSDWCHHPPRVTGASVPLAPLGATFGLAVTGNQFYRAEAKTIAMVKAKNEFRFCFSSDFHQHSSNNTSLLFEIPFQNAPKTSSQATLSCTFYNGMIKVHIQQTFRIPQQILFNFSLFRYQGTLTEI